MHVRHDTEDQALLLKGTLTPLASVIIPSSGRPLVIEMTLDALCGQTLGVETYEVIVADDGSDPPLEARLAPYVDRLRLKSVRLNSRGPSTARNVAAGLASAPLLLFLDDDCAPDSAWLMSYLLAHAENPEVALVGQLITRSPCGLATEAYQLIFSYLYTRHIQQFSTPETSTRAPFMISANFAVPTQIFHTIGGFDESFRIAAEDREFSERWARSGNRFLSVPDAIVEHHRALSIRQFLAQHFRFGRGRTMLQTAMRQRGWKRNSMESFSFYFRLVTCPLREPCVGNRVTLMFLLFLSQAWIGVGSLFEHGLASVRVSNCEETHN